MKKTLAAMTAARESRFIDCDGDALLGTFGIHIALDHARDGRPAKLSQFLIGFTFSLPERDAEIIRMLDLPAGYGRILVRDRGG